MSTAARVWLALAGFLLVTGTVYGATSHEVAGAPLLLVGSATFCYLGLVALRQVRRAARPEPEEGAEGEAPPAAEIHVAPTIWPFGFSIAAVALALGVVVTHWLLALGGVLFLLSAGGWFRDVRRQHRHVTPPEHQGTVNPG